MHRLLDYPIRPLTPVQQEQIRSGELFSLCFDGCYWYRGECGSSVLTPITASNGVQRVGDDIRLNIPGLPDQLTYDPTMTVAVWNNTTGQHEEILASLLVPSINKYTPAGVIVDADTNPAFPVIPTIGDAREITTNDGTVGGLNVTIGDLLVFGISGWFVLQGNASISVADTNSVNLAVVSGVLRAYSKAIIQTEQVVSVFAVNRPVFYNNTTAQREIATETTRTPTGFAISATEVVLFGSVIGAFAVTDVGRFVYLDDLGDIYAHPTDNGVKIGYIKSITEMIIDIDKESYGNFSYNLQRLVANSIGYDLIASYVLISKKRKYRGYLTGTSNNLFSINTKTTIVTPIDMGAQPRTMEEIEDYDYLMVVTFGSFRVLDIKTNTFIGGTYSGTGTLPNNGVINSITHIKKQNIYAISSGDNVYWFRLTDAFGGEPFDVTNVSFGYNLAGDRIYDKKMCYHETSNQLFIPNSSVGTVTVVDCETRSIVATISTGQVNNKVVREKTTDLLMLSTRNGGFVMHPRKYSLVSIPSVFGAYGAGVDLHRKLFVYCGTYPDFAWYIDPRTATIVSGYFGIGPSDADSCPFTNRSFWINQSFGQYSFTE